MNWRLFIGDYVPAEVTLDASERREVRRRARAFHDDRDARKRIRSHFKFPAWRFRLVIALFLATILALNEGTSWIGITYIGTGPAFWWVFPIRLAAIFIVALCFGTWLGKTFMRPYVFAALQERGISLCTRCDYWLRDLPADITRCPECGEVRSERFNLSEGNTSDDA